MLESILVTRMVEVYIVHIIFRPIKNYFTQICIVTSKHLALLQNKLYDIHSKWKMFGRALPLSDTDINVVEANVCTEHKDKRTKFQEALFKWKNKGGRRTWRVIHNALCNMARKDIADSIKKFHNLDSDGINNNYILYDYSLIHCILQSLIRKMVMLLK